MRRVLVLGCLCLLVYPRASEAEWHLTPMVGLTFAGNTNLFDPDFGSDNVHPNLGGWVSLLGKGLFGVEGVLVFTPNFFKGEGEGLVESSRSVIVMGNLVLTAPRRWTEYNLRPFVSGGFGLLQASYEETTGRLPLSARFAAFNIGGGAIGFFSARTGMRFDLRYYSTLPGRNANDLPLVGFGDKVHLRYMTFSVGLVLRR
jgi:hypothetical protein